MDRMPRRTGWTWTAGTVLAATLPLAAVLAEPRGTAADEPALNDLTFSDASGVQRTFNTAGRIDVDNPVFQDLGTNGRTCFTCHRRSQAWTIAPGEARRGFGRTGGLDPIFRTNDGSNCEGAEISTVRQRRRAFSLLLTKALIRIELAVPANAEFDIVDVDDPYGCGARLTDVSVYRRPLPTTNLRFLSTVMWDGRETVAGQA